MNQKVFCLNVTKIQYHGVHRIGCKEKRNGEKKSMWEKKAESQWEWESEWDIEDERLSLRVTRKRKREDKRQKKMIIMRRENGRER